MLKLSEILEKDKMLITGKGMMLFTLLTKALCREIQNNTDLKICYLDLEHQWELEDYADRLVDKIDEIEELVSAGRDWILLVDNLKDVTEEDLKKIEKLKIKIIAKGIRLESNIKDFFDFCIKIEGRRVTTIKGEHDLGDLINQAM